MSCWDQICPFQNHFAPKVTLEWIKRKHEGNRYSYYIFLNSSVRGPFLPAYMPTAWQWTRAFTDRLGGPGDVRGVSSSLVCLPEVDAGGRGPRMESWAFALDQLGLQYHTFPTSTIPPTMVRIPLEAEINSILQQSSPQKQEC